MSERTRVVGIIGVSSDWKVIGFLLYPLAPSVRILLNEVAVLIHLTFDGCYSLVVEEPPKLLGRSTGLI
jgi:hypothetical protein